VRTSQEGAGLEAPNEAQRRKAFGGYGRLRLIPDTAEDRMTWVEGIGRGQKRGWSVVCEPRAIQSASGWVSRFFFFFEIPWTPGGPTSSGSIVFICERIFLSAHFFCFLAK
jgi:hypothetical protein